jgi:hypothetical protein
MPAAAIKRSVSPSDSSSDDDMSILLKYALAKPYDCCYPSTRIAETVVNVHAIANYAGS